MSTLGSLIVKLGLDPSQFRDGLAVAEVELSGFKHTVDDSSNSSLGLSGVLDKLGTSLVGRAAEFGKLAVSAGAMASTALSLAPAIASATKWIVSTGQAAVAAAPMVLAIGASLEFVKSVVTGFGPAFTTAFAPATTAIKNAETQAGNLATAGLSPLIAKFQQLNMPAISAGMNAIATSTNGVVKGTLSWANSTAGVMAIRNVIQSTSDAFASVAPHIQAVVIAFGNMLGRITAVSTAAGASGLSGVLDKLTAWMDKVNAATVLTGLDTLKTRLGQIVTLFQDMAHWVSNAIEFYKTFQTEIQAVGTALSILAVVTGGPVVAVIAAVGLIIKYWDQLKAAYQAFIGYFTNNPIGVGFLDNLRSASQAVLGPLQKAWSAIWAAIGPVLTQIWDKIKNEFIPAMGQFIAAIAPVVGFLIGVLGPVVASVFQGILTVISGVISIITGIIKVFTALLTGDWQGAWDGVASICRGVGSIITGVIGGVFGGLAGIVAGGINAVIGIVMGLPGAILAALGGLGSLLWNAGVSVVQGLIDGIKSMLGSVGSAASSIASTIRSYLPFSPAKTGPLSGRGAPNLAGIKIASMLADGMLTGIPALTSASGRMAGAVSFTGGGSFAGGVPAPRGVATATGATADGDRTIRLMSDGKLGDLMISVMQKSARGSGLQVVNAR